MSDTFDPDEPFKLDLDDDESAEDAMRRLLTGQGNAEPITDDAAEALYGLVPEADEPAEDSENGLE